MKYSFLACSSCSKCVQNIWARSLQNEAKESNEDNCTCGNTCTCNHTDLWVTNAEKNQNLVFRVLETNVKEFLECFIVATSIL